MLSKEQREGLIFSIGTQSEAILCQSQWDWGSDRMLPSSAQTKIQKRENYVVSKAFSGHNGERISSYSSITPLIPGETEKSNS